MSIIIWYLAIYLINFMVLYILTILKFCYICYKRFLSFLFLALHLDLSFLQSSIYFLVCFFFKSQSWMWPSLPKNKTKQPNKKKVSSLLLFNTAVPISLWLRTPMTDGYHTTIAHQGLCKTFHILVITSPLSLISKNQDFLILCYDCLFFHLLQECFLLSD